MEHHMHRRMAGQEVVQVVRRQQTGRRMAGKVAPLAGVAEPVRDDGFQPALRQCRVQVRADEAGAAGDQNHGGGYRGPGAGVEAGAAFGSSDMTDRPRFFDDLAGVAGGALSALSGLRDEAEAVARARVDDAIRRLDLVRREDMEAAMALAAGARAGQEAAEAALAAVQERLADVERRLAALESAGRPSGGAPGMIV
jgi:BMFP domain-containing protein YqiC